MNAETVTVSSLDPAALSPAVRRGLDLAETYTLTRRQGGYSCGPDAKITLKTAKDMIGLKLARLDYGRSAPVLMLTSAGLQVLAVMRQRKARRAGK